MLKNKVFFIFISLLFVVSLGKSQESFNYSEIAPHPRLLLNKDVKDQLQVAITTNPNLKLVHDYIIDESSDILRDELVFYHKRGKRLLAVSRLALTRIFYLSYSYQMTGKKKYLRRAEKELNAVCNFRDWNPSHFLDVGEMTMAVAIGYDWLYHDLKPKTKKKIEQTILSHAFARSKERKYNNFLRVTNNWNQVCNAGLVYGALAIFDKHKTEAIEIIERSIKSNRLALESYAPDGNYPEGAGYWGYGTSFQVMLFAALESALGTDLGLSEAPGFLESSEYMLFVNGPIKLRFNYSDCARQQSANVPMFWFANKLNNPNLLYEELKLLEDGSFFKRLEEKRLLPALPLFSYNLDFSNASPPSKKVWSGKGITPVVLVRTDWTSSNSEYLGIKGGSTTAAHAHMDAGTFVYDSNGARWAMDLGLQSYITLESKGIKLWDKSQDSQRWLVFRYNNRNHNTLTINGRNHKIDGRAHLIETYDTNMQKGGMFDLTEVFFDDIQSAIRKVVVKENKYLELIDEITTNDQEAHVRWTMVSPSEAQIIDSNTIELTQNRKKKIVSFISDHPIELKLWNSENPGTTYDAPNPRTIMIGFESVIPSNKHVVYQVTIKDKE